MAWLREHALRCVGTLFVIALTLAPIALSGHHHTTFEGGASSRCAMCVATHHAPAVHLPLLPRIVPILHGFQLPASHVVAPAQVFRPFTTGRAPPVSFTLHVA